MGQVTRTYTVCDKCQREADGDSPDCVYAAGTYCVDHDLCCECLPSGKYQVCPVCNEKLNGWLHRGDFPTAAKASK